MKKSVLVIFAMLCALVLSAQAPADRKEVRSGNRDFRKGNYKEADIDYRRALVKDSTSLAANYNLANTLYRQENYQEAAKYAETAENTALTADVCFNKGDIALQNKDYNTAVEAFKQSLLLNPGDLEAKENYIYAKKMLEDQQQNGGGQGGDNQQNQDQNNDQNQDQNQDNKDNDQNKDNQNDNQNQDSNQGQNQDNDRNQDQQQDQQQDQPQLSQQAVQQMLQAIEAKEKETQEKVKKEKALQAKSRQKDKNW